MNKVLKGISIVALVLLLLGISFTVCGLLLGGTMAFSYTPGQRVNTIRNRNFHMVTEEMESFHSIQVDTDYFDVRVTPGETFSVTYPEGEWMDCAYTVEDDKLSLTVQEKGKSGIHVFGYWGFAPSLFDNEDNEDDTIIVTIPEGTDLKDIIIQSADGDCMIEQQSADNYTLDLSYGDLALTDCIGKVVDIQSGDGDVDIHSGKFDSLLGELSYGSCNVEDSVIDTASFELSDGSLNLSDGTISSVAAKLSYGDFTIKHTKVDFIDSRLSDGDFTASIDEAEEVFSTNIDAKDGVVTINGKDMGEH
ncbi:MAG: DUF4097 family beta strand repeat-containing protein, partial [Lachnospiraceae bacterium]